MNENFNETVFNCITSVNALMTSNEVAKDDKAVIKLNRFKKWLNKILYENLKLLEVDLWESLFQI